MAYSGSASDRLTAVREAINRCLTSQSYSIRGRQQVMAQLATLRAMEKDLQEEANIEANSSQMASLAIFTRPS